MDHILVPYIAALLGGIVLSFVLKESGFRSVVRAGTITLFVIPLGFFLWLWLSLSGSHDEVKRISSPDGKTDAVVIEENGGATTSFNYLVEVGPKSSRHLEKAVSVYGATRNSNAYGVNLRWTDNSNLSVEYLDAKRAPEFFNQIVVIDNKKVQITV